VSDLPIRFDRDDGEDTQFRRLLALRALRRDLERVASPRTRGPTPVNSPHIASVNEDEGRHSAGIHARPVATFVLRSNDNGLVDR
jgi:hypothetical protein